MDWTPEKMIDAMRRCANPTSRCMVKDCPAAALVEHRCQDLMIAWGAEQIERDQKELAELREKIPQWINCKDRMPPDRVDKYLVTFRGDAGALVDVAKYFPGDGWFCEDWPVPSNEITRWMPLPEAQEDIP